MSSLSLKVFFNYGTMRTVNAKLLLVNHVGQLTDSLSGRAAIPQSSLREICHLSGVCPHFLSDSHIHHCGGSRRLRKTYENHRDFAPSA
ncbi:MAG: hypothetical protein RR860_05055 [Janthinobacterium sp.]